MTTTLLQTTQSTVTAQDLEQMIAQIRQSAHSYWLKNPSKQKPYYPKAEEIKPFTYFAQGDMNMNIVPHLPEKAGLKQVKDFGLRLVPGPQTRGSSHCIYEGHAQNIEYWVLPNPNPLQGAFLVLPAGKELLITHPEHQDYHWGKFDFDLIMLISYQRSMEAADRITRALD